MEPSTFQDKRSYILLFLGLFFVISSWLVLPPLSFPVDSIITVTEGDGLYKLADSLKKDKVIRSPFWFRMVAVVLGGERDMKAGQYYLSHPQNVFMIAWRVFHGDHNIETIKLTIPEGFTIEQISTLFDERFVFFDHEDFLKLAPEGYLFPDTYFVPLTATASSTIKLLNENFLRKIFKLASLIESSGKTLEEIITMASILEREAKTKKDREIISDILWKRLELDIALQVDASFIYVNGKTTKELTQSDLKIDSPYNTYLYRGLPPTPISNPGLESIEAALHPTTTPYLYFLTADDGAMHYSRTFDEHVSKKLKYIKN
jgi:UPF0755 protein